MQFIHMPTDNLTTPGSITQNIAMVDFLEQSQLNQDAAELKYSGGSEEYYIWLASLLKPFTKPAILDIFSSEDPDTSTYLRQAGYNINITDAQRDNLDFLNNLAGAQIENPAVFFDLLIDTITKQYEVVIWHNPQIELTPSQITISLTKIADCLVGGGLLLTNMDFADSTLSQFANKFHPSTEQSFTKNVDDQKMVYQVLTKTN